MKVKKCIICNSEMPLKELVEHLNDKLMLVYRLIIQQEQEIKEFKEKTEKCIVCNEIYDETTACGQCCDECVDNPHTKAST